MRRQKEKPMYKAYISRRKAASRDDSVDIHELNAQTDISSSSSDETVIPMPRFNISRPQSPHFAGTDKSLENGLNKARSHWIQLYKINVQNQIVQKTFINILQNHPQTRPIWQFSRKLDVNEKDWTSELTRNIQFRHHCSSIQAALTMIMDNLDDQHGMAKLLQEIGSHHFYYDAYEPHFDLMQEGFMLSLRQALENTTEYPDTALCRSWNQLWDQIKINIGKGISNQRRIYLIQCITPTEMNQVRSTWMQVKRFGIEEAGSIVTGTALKAYSELITQYKINLSVNIDEHGEVFQKFALEVIKELPHVLKDFVHHCIVLDVCPSLVRRAFMQGLTTMLNEVLGHMNEDTVHLWNKVYRVLEQAILTNILKY